MRELWFVSKPSVLEVIAVFERASGHDQHRIVNSLALTFRVVTLPGLIQELGNLLRLFNNGFTFVLESVQRSCQNLVKTGHSHARFGWPVGSPEKKLLIGCQKYIQRPAALSSYCDDGIHVNLVDVRTFFAIDFDTHKVLVQDFCDCFVFETFVLHHVTPVTG